MIPVCLRSKRNFVGAVPVPAREELAAPKTKTGRCFLLLTLTLALTLLQRLLPINKISKIGWQYALRESITIRIIHIFHIYSNF
jgi:hypothetical protein